jgi:hypothetical protein
MHIAIEEHQIIRCELYGLRLFLCGGNQVGQQTLYSNEPAGRSSGHRLATLLPAPIGAGSKTNSARQTSNMLTRTKVQRTLDTTEKEEMKSTWNYVKSVVRFYLSGGGLDLRGSRPTLLCKFMLIFIGIACASSGLAQQYKYPSLNPTLPIERNRQHPFAHGGRFTFSNRQRRELASACVRRKCK